MTTLIDWGSPPSADAIAKAKRIIEPSQSPYFRCPLAMLRFPADSAKDQMRHILNYCVADVGEKVADKLGPISNARLLMRECFQSPSNISTERIHAFLGLRKLSIHYPDPLNYALEEAKAARGWLQRQPANEQNATFTAPCDVFWACFYQLRGEHKSDFLGWDEFRVLMAIGSKLGNRQFGKCGWREIQCRAEGRLEKYGDGLSAGTLTRKQIRDLVDSLWLQGRIRRISKRGEAIYGIGLSEEDLIRRIIEQKTKVSTLRSQRQVSNQRAVEAIKNAVAS